MERIFTESINKVDGTPRFMEGSTRDFPPAVWNELAKQVGKPLNEFAVEPKDFFRLVMQKGTEESEEKSPRRPRLKKE